MSALSLTQTEAEEKLEELQQQVTLNLQEIDKNFAECTRIINELTIPGVERYAEQTSAIWELSKVWSAFFEAMDFRTKLPSYDDDPPLPLFSPSSTNREHTMSNISAYAKGLRKQIQEDSTQDTTTSEYSKPTHLEDSGSMSFIGTKRKNPDSIRSPPRIMPYITEPSSLANTPRNEAARILTENSLQAVDMGESISPDDESMQSFYEHTPSHVASDKQSWQDTPVREDWDNTNLMETESEEQRRNFDIFIQKRQTAKSKVADQELQRRWTGALRSPSNRASKPIQQQQHEEEQSKLVGTPTIERVLNRKQLNLKKDNYFLQDEDEDMGAYEFSDKLPTQ